MTETTHLFWPRLVFWPRLAIFGLILGLGPVTAHAGADPYKVTPAEKAACTQDAIRLCMDAYPDEQKLVICMKQNRAALSPTCRVAFDSGVKRRHL